MRDSALVHRRAFIQFDLCADAEVTRCETNEDVQVVESSEHGSIDEFDASMLPRTVGSTATNGGYDKPALEPVRKPDVSSSQRAPPRLPVRNKTNEDMPPQIMP